MIERVGLYGAVERVGQDEGIESVGLGGAR